MYLTGSRCLMISSMDLCSLISASPFPGPTTASVSLRGVQVKVLKRVMRQTNATDRIAIVAAEQDTEVDKHFHGEFHVLQGPLQAKFFNWLLARLREGKVPQDHTGAEREGIHILRANCEALSCFH